MVKVTINGVNFYTTLKKNIVEDLATKAVLAEIEGKSRAQVKSVPQPETQDHNSH